jgi:CRP/FNR family transcriptional regulator, cyclic AMP receptor protein
MVQTLRPLLAEHPFFEQLDPSFLDLIVGCAKNVRFDADEHLFNEGDLADGFFLIRSGRVAVELLVHHQPIVVNTFGPGELLGWSWLVPPHHWHFDARAVEVTRAIEVSGPCLRDKCDANPALGYAVLKRLAHDIERRLYRSWTQMVDVYGPP